MKRIGLPRCPGCQGAMLVTELRCPACATQVRGEFVEGFAELSPEQTAFARRFLLARGNLKEMERGLGVSYQVLRGQLDELVAALGEREVRDLDDPMARLRRGELTAEQALVELEARASAPRCEDAREDERHG